MTSLLSRCHRFARWVSLAAVCASPSLVRAQPREDRDALACSTDFGCGPSGRCVKMRCVYPHEADGAAFDKRDESASEPAKPSTWNVSVVGGALFPVEIDLAFEGGGGILIDTETGWLTIAEGDFVVLPFLSVGAFLAFGRTHLKLPTPESMNLINLGGNIKGRFSLFEMGQIRPGVSIGYSRIVSSFRELDNTNGLALNAFVEGILPVTEHFSLVTEGGMLAQPLGRSAGNGVTYFPLFYAAAGIEYGG